MTKADRLARASIQALSVLFARYHQFNTNDPEYVYIIEQYADIIEKLMKEYQDLNRQGVTRISMVQR